MSGALAIASVTAVLKDLLSNGLIGCSEIASVGDVSVSTLPPDRITTGAEERNQLNVFMYRIAPYAGLRKTPSKTSAVKAVEPPRHPGLAVELSYLLTAYGAQDFHAEIVLGCAMHLLCETPVLAPDMIRGALGSKLSAKAKSLVPPAQAALGKSDLADQVEQIKITPQFLNSEEMSKLWSSLQARYRPSVAYQVSAVVINGRQ